jgi:RNA polymerase sigma-70 factor, ECF subfamily
MDFVRLFQPLIAAVVIKVMRSYEEFDRTLADDLVQDVYVRLCKENCKALRQFEHRHEDSIFGFVKIVAVSVAMDHFRARKRNKRGADMRTDVVDVDATISAPTPDVHRRLTTEEIFVCLDRVASNSRDRSIFALYYRQGYSTKEIAMIPGIGLSAKGVESTILRLVQAIRKEIVPSNPNKRGPNEGLSSMPSVGDVR